MSRMLVTGMSGTGKSALLAELHRRGPPDRRHRLRRVDSARRDLGRAAALDVLMLRIRGRTNPYGSTAQQRAEIADDLRDVEPLLRGGATLELDGRRPVPTLADRLETVLHG